VLPVPGRVGFFFVASLPTLGLLLQQNRHGSVRHVHHGKIEFPIAIEICRRDLVRAASYSIRRTRCLCECPIAVPKQKRDCADSIVCDREVQFPIVIEIRRYDRVDAGKICDCLRCDFLPEYYMASTAIRERRRTLRYRNLLVRQMVQMKNKTGMLLMEAGGRYARCPHNLWSVRQFAAMSARAVFWAHLRAVA